MSIRFTIVKISITSIPVNRERQKAVGTLIVHSTPLSNKNVIRFLPPERSVKYEVCSSAIIGAKHAWIRIKCDAIERTCSVVLYSEGKKIDATTKLPDTMFLRASGNIPTVRTTNIGEINVYDILNCRKMVFTVDAVKKIEDIYTYDEEVEA